MIFDSTISRDTIQKWYKDKPNTTFDDLLGMEALKARLRDEIAQILDPANPAPSRSYFFYGLPGTGKTLAIRAFVRELMDAGYRCISLSGGDSFTSYVGEAEKTVYTAFQEAMDNAPCVIVLDEIENICLDRFAPSTASHQMNLTVAILSSWRAMLRSGKPVILLTASCHPQLVDEMFIRNSRCIRFDLPDAAARSICFSRMLQNLPLEEGFSFQDMAKATPNYSFRYLSRLHEEITLLLKDALYSKYTVLDPDGNVNREASDKACVEALTSGRFPITRAMFEAALRAYPPSDKSRLLREQDDFENRYQF